MSPEAMNELRLLFVGWNLGIITVGLVVSAVNAIRSLIPPQEK